VSICENAFPKQRSVASLKATLTIVVIVLFGILHVVGAMMLHNTAAPRQTDSFEATANRD
jgi:hypothetical protein